MFRVEGKESSGAEPEASRLGIIVCLKPWIPAACLKFGNCKTALGRSSSICYFFHGFLHVRCLLLCLSSFFLSVFSCLFLALVWFGMEIIALGRCWVLGVFGLGNS